MKRKTWAILLGAEAVLCLVGALFGAPRGNLFAAALKFPFEALGDMLRSLSLSGAGRNAAAIAIYVIFCLLPIVALPVVRFGFSRDRRLYPEDLLILLLSLLLFWAEYLMINPGLIAGILGMPGEATEMGKIIFGGIVYTMLAGYLVLRALRLIFRADERYRLRWMRALLCIFSVICVFAAFGLCLGELIAAASGLNMGSISGGVDGPLWVSERAGSHGINMVFLILQYVVNALPWLLDVAVIFAGLRLLDALGEDRYGEKTAAAAGSLSRICAIALAATVLSNVGFNLLQLLFARSLMSVNTSLQLPLTSIAFVLAALLLSGMITEGRKLKEDNDLFI